MPISEASPPDPTVGFPVTSNGGQAAAQESEQALVVPGIGAEQIERAAGAVDQNLAETARGHLDRCRGSARRRLRRARRARGAATAASRHDNGDKGKRQHAGAQSLSVSSHQGFACVVRLIAASCATLPRGALPRGVRGVPPIAARLS